MARFIRLSADFRSVDNNNITLRHLSMLTGCVQNLEESFQRSVTVQAISEHSELDLQSKLWPGIVRADQIKKEERRSCALMERTWMEEAKKIWERDITKDSLCTKGEKKQTLGKFNETSSALSCSKGSRSKISQRVPTEWKTKIKRP